MDDINFDELDKAVNSALQQSVPKTTLTDTPVPDPSLEAAVDPPAPQPTAGKTPIFQKPRGQFMDMVHPSSDMIRPGATMPNRQAATIQPLDPAIVNDTAPYHPAHREPQLSSPQLSTTEDIPTANTDNSASAMPASEWPDPLDVVEHTEQDKHEDMPEQNSVATDQVADQRQINTEEEQMSDLAAETETATATDSEPNADTTATSPFINGAELEKRPLGAFAESTVPSDATETTTDKSADMATDKDEAAEHDTREELPTVPVPQELTPEIVSVESDDSAHSFEETGEAATVESTPSDNSGLAASIAPQYTNNEASTDESGDHPVFDTKEYHQPLTPPIKKGHGGLVAVLMLVLVVLLGACAWYAIAVLKLV